jgi:hypothetical protein
MLSTEAQTQNQSQQSTIYDDDCVFNERIGQLFNSIDSTSVSSPNTNRKQMTSIVDHHVHYEILNSVIINDLL